MAQLEQFVDVGELSDLVVGGEYFLQIPKRLHIRQVAQSILFDVQLDQPLTLTDERQLADLSNLVLVEYELA